MNENLNIEEPIFRHVGLLSYDAKKTAEFLSSLFNNLEPWLFIERVYEKEDVIFGTPSHVMHGLSKCGNMSFEIVEPISPDSYHAMQIKEHGEGFHHIAYVYPRDFDLVLDNMLTKGYKIVWAGQRPNGPRVYYLTDDGGGTVVEILDRALPLTPNNP